MTHKRIRRSGIRGDPKREACKSLYGYDYQIWNSVDAWMELGNEESLYLEVAEDFAVADTESLTAAQVKARAGNLTLRSSAVLQAIRSYWHLRENNRSRKVLFRLISTASRGVEAGSPFGEGVRGLDIWDRCVRRSELDVRLRTFLSEIRDFPVELQQFIRTEDDATIVDLLLRPITWETEYRDITAVQAAVERKLIHLGETYGVWPEDSASVASRLHSEAWATARAKDHRELNRDALLRIFEKETSERVPKRRMSVLEQAFFDRRLTERSSMLRAAPARTPSPEVGQAVEIPAPTIRAWMARRKQVVGRMKALLVENGALIINGSTGSGKTILAALLAEAVGGSKWNWIMLTDLEPSRVVVRLRHLEDALEQSHGPINVILDDLDLTQAAARQYYNYLAGLLHTVLERNGLIIITGQTHLPPRLQQSLGLGDGVVQQAPPFDQSEIADFAVQNGCQETGLAQSWASLIRIHTLGHPQLVHARVAKLRQAGWPEITPKDLLRTPADVLTERSMARRRLIGDTGTDEREMLYRLSIVMGLFRRDQAIAIGGIKPEIAYPSDAFDRLVGPWIESIGAHYYRISPLLQSAASEAWGDAKAATFHAPIAHAITNCGWLTTIEARAAFIHAWLGRDEKLLVPITLGILNSAERVWKHLASELAWVLTLRPVTKGAVFPKDPVARLTFRSLQFRVAVETDPAEGITVAHAWDKDAEECRAHPLFLWFRFMFTSQVLVYYQIELPPRYLLGLLTELDEVTKALKECPKPLPDFESPLAAAMGIKEESLTAAMFTFFIPRCTGAWYLGELMDGLKELDPAVRAEALSSVRAIESEAVMLIERAWFNESKATQPDWQKCISVFARVIECAKEWNTPSLGRSAARGIAIVQDEFLHEESEAIRVLGKVESEFGTSPILQDERATVHLNNGRYQEALDIWDKLLPIWSEPPQYGNAKPVFACRGAGIAAARTENWQKAAAFFLDGYERARTIDYQQIAVGFLGDAGFALWKAGQPDQCVQTLQRALEEFEKLPNPQSDLASHTLNKLLGHTILWIESTQSGKESGELGEPHPGMCSNPERRQEFKELPFTPLDILWLYVAQIEWYMGLGSKLFDQLQPRLKDSVFPVVRFVSGFFRMELSFTRLQFEHLPEIVVRMQEAQEAERAQRAEGRQLLEPAAAKTMQQGHSKSKPDLGTEVFVAALVALIRSDRFSRDIFDTWRSNAETLPGSQMILQWIELAEGTLTLEVDGAAHIVRDGNETRSKRLLAAARVALAETASAADLFYAHLLLLTALREGSWEPFVADHLAAIVERQWRKATRFPGGLRAPRATIPAIEKACENEDTGFRKTAQILLAAKDAVFVKLPLATLTNLRTIASGEIAAGA